MPVWCAVNDTDLLKGGQTATLARHFGGEHSSDMYAEPFCAENDSLIHHKPMQVSPGVDQQSKQSQQLVQLASGAVTGEPLALCIGEAADQADRTRLCAAADKELAKHLLKLAAGT